MRDDRKHQRALRAIGRTAPELGCPARSALAWCGRVSEPGPVIGGETAPTDSSPKSSVDWRPSLTGTYVGSGAHIKYPQGENVPPVSLAGSDPPGTRPMRGRLSEATPVRNCHEHTTDVGAVL